MSKPTNEQRRELVQTLLVVGGIVGGVIASQPSYSSVLPSLVLFVGITTAFYCMLFIEKTPKSYPVAALAIAGSFASLLYSIVAAVDKSPTQADFTGVLSFAAITVALLVDWNKYNAQGDKPEMSQPSTQAMPAEKTKKESGLRQIYRRPIGKLGLWVSAIGVGTMTAGALGAILTLTPLTSNELLLTTYLIGLSISLCGISLLGATLTEMHADERFDELTKMISPPTEKNPKPETPNVPQTGTPERLPPNEPHEDQAELESPQSERPAPSPS